MEDVKVALGNLKISPVEYDSGSNTYGSDSSESESTSDRIKEVDESYQPTNAPEEDEETESTATPERDGDDKGEEKEDVEKNHKK